MIVDDELLSRESLINSVQWEFYGYHICGESTNGKLALERIKASRPDVIFLDIKMPVMDGMELLRLLHSEQYPGKIVMLTCYDDFDYVREALRLAIFTSRSQTGWFQ